MGDDEQGNFARDGLKVRKASAADGDAFVHFNRAMALETEGKELAEDIVISGVKAVFDDPARGFYVVAEYATEIVAALMITFEWSDWRNADFWWIQSVYVSPKFRRRGVYRRLYEFVHEHARNDGGVCGIRLYVEKDNLAAQRTYESLGMSASGYWMYEETLSQ